MSFVLVRYLDDEVLYVTRKSYLKPTKNKGIYSVKYKDGYSYSAYLLTSGDKNSLESIRLNILKNERSPLKRDPLIPFTPRIIITPVNKNGPNTNTIFKRNVMKKLDYEERFKYNDFNFIQQQYFASGLNASADSHPKDESNNLIQKRKFVESLDSDNSVNNCDKSKEFTVDKVILHSETESNKVNNIGKNIFSDGNYCLPFEDSDLDAINIHSENESSILSNVVTNLNIDPSILHNINESNNNPNIETTIEKSDFFEINECTENHEDSSTKNNVHNQKSNKRPKIYFCIFCKKEVHKFARHLERHHGKQEEVQNYLALPMKSKERLNIIRTIRNKGSFLYNGEEGNTNIIVNRNPQNGSEINMLDYLPCSKCKGYYRKYSIRKHLKHCGLFLGRMIQSTCRIENNPLANEFMKNTILPKLKNDEISNTVKNDSLILEFGNLLCRKYATKPHLDYHIRNKLRLLGRFVITAKKINKNIINLSMCLDPLHFNTIIEAINELAEYDHGQRMYKKPSVATTTGTALKQCALRIIAITIRSDTELKDKAKQFIELYDIEFGALVATTAVENINQSKWNKPGKLPSVSDIQKLNFYLDNQCKKDYEILKENDFSYLTWVSLLKHVLIKLLVFNRRRSGEIERLLISSYKIKQQIQEESDLFKTLDSEEKYLSKTFWRVEIRGKLGRRVPVLLKNNLILYIDLLLSMRKQAGVTEQNPFVFGKGNSHLSACKEMRSISSLCGASNPELLRGTYLRKQIATISQTMNLRESDVQLVADFMGHDLSIHKAHYRKPEIAMQTGKVSKLLMAAEDPEVETYRGKNLDTLSVSMSNPEVLKNYNYEQSSSECESKKSDKNINRYSTSSSSDSEIQFLKKNTKTKKKRRGKEKLRVTRRTWITPEKSVVRRLFADNFQSYKLPSLIECAHAIRDEPVLEGRTPEQVKAWINNNIILKKNYLNLE